MPGVVVPTITPREIQSEALPLNTYLRPYQNILAEQGVEEIMINHPGELFVEIAGQGIERRDDINNNGQRQTFEGLRSLTKLIANYSIQTLNEVDTLLSASLPSGERVQIVLPPSVEPGHICVAIRKPSDIDHSLESLADLGAFKHVREPASGFSEQDAELLALRRDGRIVDFLAKAVQYRKNIVISGGTSAGKTTLANAMMKYIADYDRIITIEDVREVFPTQPNRVHLLASKGNQGTAKAGVGDLFAACLRLRPDRIMLSEIRGQEAYDYLNSATSGHPGSITTVHADSIRSAVERLARYVGSHPAGRNIQDLESYIRQSVDIIIQVNKNTRTGWRGVTDIWFDPDEQDI